MLAEKQRQEINLNQEEDEEIKWSSDEDSPKVNTEEVVFEFHESQDDKSSVAFKSDTQALDHEESTVEMHDLTVIQEVAAIDSLVNQTSNADIENQTTKYPPSQTDIEHQITGNGSQIYKNEIPRNDSPTLSVENRCGSSFAIVAESLETKTLEPIDDADKGNDWGDWD